ncbi:MAG: radical SAM protein [Elusimicrobia bacterium]|nr:radical SAM protein [Elusimicrobiota bacterium]
MEATLRRVYWETTAGCNLRCIHCRRVDALWRPSPDELTTAEGKGLIDQLASAGKPVLIFSGGEPLSRKDFFTLASYARNLGLPIALATNGTLVTEALAQQLRETGIYYASVSLDGATPATHDRFRGKDNFARVLKGFWNLKQAGIKVQINYTVTKDNVGEVPKMYELAQAFGAHALYLFLLVPVGCGVQIADSHILSTEQVEEWLKWVVQTDQKGSLPIKAICAPQYYRVEAAMLDGNSAAVKAPGDRKGCLAGIHMCFISHKGEVYPCGYLPSVCGDVRKVPFKEIWGKSEVFQELRDPELLKGKCGLCPIKAVCGGCRARGYYAYQDLLAEEPFCAFEPQAAH